MKLLWITYIVLIGVTFSQAKKGFNSSITISAKSGTSNSSTEKNKNVHATKAQRRRDPGYSFSEAEFIRSSTASHFLSDPIITRGRFVGKLSTQVSKPFNRYGPPTASKNLPFKSGVQLESQREKTQMGFTEADPIASQNNQPFNYQTANYLPPQNQKLPTYSTGYHFSPTPSNLNQQMQHNPSSQKIVDQNSNNDQSQISDAALFLFQNAQALQELYGAPALNQNYAPNTNEFLSQDAQISTETPGFNSQNSQSIANAQNVQQTLKRIQSLERSKLIAQLQRALAFQSSRNTDESSDLENSLGSVKSPSFPIQRQNYATFHNPSLQLATSYGVPTISTPSFAPTPTAPLTTTTPPQSSSKHPSGNCNPQLDVSSSSDKGSQLPSSAGSGIPLYPNFVPTFIAGPNIYPNIPSYGAALPGTTLSSSPTHFNVPIPIAPQGNNKPTLDISPTSESHPPTSTSPSSFGNPSVFVPVSPPVVRPTHPAVAPVYPVRPLLPTAPAQDPLASSAHPTYGVQTPLIQPFLIKPVKPIHPVYFYPNVAYQLQKSNLPTQPWNYAPSYQTPVPQAWK